MQCVTHSYHKTHRTQTQSNFDATLYTICKKYLKTMSIFSSILQLCDLLSVLWHKTSSKSVQLCGCNMTTYEEIQEANKWGWMILWSTLLFLALLQALHTAVCCYCLFMLRQDVHIIYSWFGNQYIEADESLVRDCWRLFRRQIKTTLVEPWKVISSCCSAS